MSHQSCLLTPYHGTPHPPPPTPHTHIHTIVAAKFFLLLSTYKTVNHQGVGPTSMGPCEKSK